MWDMDQQVDIALAKNMHLKARNARLASEVRDLKVGTEAIEERARFELGMIKQDEIFVHVLEPGAAAKGHQLPEMLPQPAVSEQQPSDR